MFIYFLRGISPKVNVIAQLEFELVYFETAVQHFNLYTKGTPPHKMKGQREKKKE